MNPELLKPIYQFLLKNRRFNKKAQCQYYQSIISQKNTQHDKVISLLYHIANTQSQPSIDKLANFYQTIYADIDCTSSFEKFVKKVSGIPNSKLYKDLFNGLRKQDGWGDKTSALFVKSIYHAHNGNYSEHIRIWSDAPTHIIQQDELKLPVDSVIIKIFDKLRFQKPNFININNILSQNYHGSEIEVWDDLWFWGFITQKGSGKDRIITWNENKYWSIENTDKNPARIKTIKTKAEQFMLLLG